MEISRETAGGTSIRLRYSRQFQHGGQAHTIDAEALLAVGAEPERREQVIRELEQGVEQLARQIVQRGSRVASEASAQARAGATASRGMELATPPRQAAPSAPRPVSESMPPSPAASSERTITLADFLKAIKNRWDMTPQEAMGLLNVTELTGINYRDAYNLLRTIKEPGSSSPQRTRLVSQPTGEIARQPARSTPASSSSHSSASLPAPDTAPIPRPSAAETPVQETRVPQTEQNSTLEARREALQAFAASPKAPVPLHIGVVREQSSRSSHSFDEEESGEEEEYELPVDKEDVHLHAAESKLEELKGIRTGNAASAERLTVLANILDGQIADEQLEQLIKLIWGTASRKRLKNSQVEALISWAKEDYFVDEVESLLEMVDDEEDE